MKKITLLLQLIFMICFSTTAQNIGMGTTSPDSSALLDVKSTSKGFLPPRMTYAQRNAIVNPSQGLIVYCTNCDSSGQLQVFNGNRWANMLGGLASNPVVTNLPSVTIGSQIWSTQNLDVITYRNGDTIPRVDNPTTWANLTSGAWCWYNYSSSNGVIYGKLYNWYAVTDPRGIAPLGWHVPSHYEWNVLLKYLDASADTSCIGCPPSTIAGGKMKTTGTSQAGTGLWGEPNAGATNSSGFSGLPGGYCYYNNFIFALIGSNGFWWSSTEFNATTAWSRGLYYGSSEFSVINSSSKKLGYSVRVVRD